MQLVIDKSFLNGFLARFDWRDPCHDDFRRFLFRLRAETLELVTNVASIDELLRLAEGNPLWEAVIEKIPRIRIVEDLAAAVQTADYYQDGPPFRLFFLDADTVDCAELQRRFGFLYLDLNNLSSQWRVFLADGPNKLAVVNDDSLPDAMRFDRWEKLSLFRHPFNSLLIFDRYLLSDQYKTRMDDNVKPLLATLLEGHPEALETDVFIVSQHVYKPGANRESRQEKIVQEHLKKFLLRRFPNLKLRLNVVKYDKSLYYKLWERNYTKEHDRYIVSNYFYIESGAGFNLFNKHGEANQRTKVEFNFVFRPENWALAVSTLNNLRKYVEIAKDYYPEKNSRLLRWQSGGPPEQT